MSLSDILGTAVSGLNASQAGLSTVSNNIANVNTPGYARERVTTSSNVSAGRVNGVTVSEPSRVADRFLESTVYRRGGDAGQAEIISNYLDQLQSFLGTPGGTSTNAGAAGNGLPTDLDDLLSKATAMTGSQDPAQYSNQFVLSAQNTLDGISTLSGDIDGLRANVATDVSGTVGRINTLLKQVDQYNDQVAQLQSLGRSVSGPADQRMSALEELSGLINVNIQSQSNGRVTIETASGQQLLDSRLRLLSYPDGNDGSQSSYPAIEIRFADASGNIAASTGQSIDGSAIGGKLGGLLQLRDATLPGYGNQLNTLLGGLAQSLNAASNASTTAPAPATLNGRPSGLVGSDRLGFTGAATFAVTGADGTLLAKTSVDFNALGPTATVDDAVAAINAGLGGQATATLAADGTLSITANTSGTGVVVAQDPNAPSDRAGVGFSQYFGLNDLVRGSGNPLVPSGFQAGDPSGFAAGQTAQVVLADGNGRPLASYTVTGATGQTFGDIVNALNSSDLGSFGTFALDNSGRINFTATAAAAGVTLSIPADSTDRLGTGVTFTALSGLPGKANGMSAVNVRPDIATDARNLSLGTFDASAAIGAKAIGNGDTSAANRYVDALSASTDFGSAGQASVVTFAGQLFTGISADSSQAATATTNTTARRSDAVARRDNFSGVNVDEELAQMVMLQNSYSASARVLTTASDMYDTLINMVS